MNTTLLYNGSNDLVPPLCAPSSNGPVSSGWGTRRGPCLWFALLAGLLLLLLNAPAARAQGVPPGCTGSGIGITLFTSAPDVHVGDTICYGVLVFNGSGVGPIVCDASNIVAFIVTPDNVSHPVALVHTYLVNGQSDYYPSNVCYVVRQQDIVSDGMGGSIVRATASDTATIYQNDKPSQGGANQGVNTEVSQPCLGLTVQCSGSVGQTGAITFSGTVTNCGNDTLVSVTITNLVNGGAFPVVFITNILSGQAASFNGSWVPVNPCSPSTATLVAAGTDQFTTHPQTVTSSANTTCSEVLTPGILVSKTCPVAPVAPGQLLTFSGSVSNPGNVTLTGIVVVNNQPVPNTTVFAAASLAPGAITNFTGSYLAPAVCSISDTLVATATSTCGIPVTNTASATCPLATRPVIAVTQTCPASPTVPGALLTYSGTVTNLGNIAITNVVVLNNLSGSSPIFTAGTLAPGMGASFTGSYVTPTNCSTTSTLTASGQSVCGMALTNTASATCEISTTPILALTQTCPAIPPAPGALLIYSGTVTNLGNIIITNVVVRNNLSGSTPVFTAATLAPGAGASFTGSYLTPTNCATTSTSTATGQSVCGIPVESTASATCEIAATPMLSIFVACPANPVPAGSLFTYSGFVSNTGSITLTNVVVLNSLSGVIFTGLTLLPSQATNFTGSYLAPTNCSTTSTSTASGMSVCGLTVTNSVTTTCAIVTTPALVVTVACPTNPVYPGGLLTYTGSVSNSGNVTLTNVIVVSDRPVPGTMICFCSSCSLAPGATVNFSGSYLTPLDCCVVWSTVQASGQACAGVTVTDEDTTTCIIATLPQLVITKVCTPGPLQPGSLLTYSGSVSNAGNITLINVTVVDSAAPNNSPLPGDTDLAPGQSVSFDGAYVVPPDFCGNDTLTASGLDVCNYLPVIDSVTTTCPITTTPRITVTKNCPLLPTPRGGLYTFTGSVSNAGNVSLVNVYVTDDQPTNNTPVIGPITVAPGLSVNFTNSYVAPVCCCLIIDTLTARGQDHCSGSNVTDTATAVCPLLTIPTIAVVPNCPANPIPMGSVYHFSGYVTNTSAVVLTNVWVFGPQGTNPPVLGPLDLAPGQAEAYSGTYTVPFNTCSVSVTAVGQETCGGTYATNTASCPVAILPAIAITESCPPGPVSAGSTVVIGGSVTNVGNITLMNVMVFSDQSSNSNPVLGPITLAPGASAPFLGSYLATGGSNPTTNWMIITNGIGSIVTNLVSYIVTNSVVTVTTNSGLPVFGTIDPVALTITPRFNVPSTLHGLMYADQDENWGATLFYASSQPSIGVDTFDTISTIPPMVGYVTNRFNLTSTNYDALTLAAPDVGYGAMSFYYIRHTSSGASTFGEIIAQGASSSADLWTIPNSGYTGLAFAGANVGYGTDLFYYVRNSLTGLATFGTINPTPGGIVTDRYTVGTNFDSLVFVPGAVSTWGTAIFAYLRHDRTGSTIGTINPVTRVATDRMSLGTNRLSDLTFTATDVGYGANLFYYIGRASSGLVTNNVHTFTTNTVATVTTNTVLTYATNIVVSFTPTNTVTATGVEVCQDSTVGAAANCLGPITAVASSPLISKPGFVNGTFSLTFPTATGETYTLEYKNKLTDPAWTNLQTVPGTGLSQTITDPTAVGQPTRFYRILVSP